MGSVYTVSSLPSNSGTTIENPIKVLRKTVKAGVSSTSSTDVTFTLSDTDPKIYLENLISVCMVSASSSINCDFLRVKTTTDSNGSYVTAFVGVIEKVNSGSTASSPAIASTIYLNVAYLNS